MTPLRRIVLIALVGLAWLATASLVAAQAAKTVVFELEIVDGKLTISQNVLRVTEGDKVELRWTSDGPVELHLHGYDIELDVAPGAPSVMAFEAHATGRYPIEIHGHGGGQDETPLVYLEVHPR